MGKAAEAENSPAPLTASTSKSLSNVICPAVDGILRCVTLEHNKKINIQKNTADLTKLLDTDRHKYCEGLGEALCPQDSPDTKFRLLRQSTEWGLPWMQHTINRSRRHPCRGFRSVRQRRLPDSSHTECDAHRHERSPPALFKHTAEAPAHLAACRSLH